MYIHEFESVDKHVHVHVQIMYVHNVHVFTSSSKLCKLSANRSAKLVSSDMTNFTCKYNKVCIYIMYMYNCAIIILYKYIYVHVHVCTCTCCT